MDSPNPTDFAWAIIGPGHIAHRFADAVDAMPGNVVHGILGRDPARVADFLRRRSRPGRYPPRLVTDLPALLADPRIDAVYIATPHASHGGFVRQCIAAGKPVLCEKPFVPTLAEARALIALAQDKQVFLMEALWTRLLPVYAGVGRWLQAGAIGGVRSIDSSFCFAVPFDPDSRLFNPALAGGALLDLGIYNLAMTRWVLETVHGTCPEPMRLQVSGVLAPSGVDQRTAATLDFPDGVTARFVCAFDGTADNALHIRGELGSITLPGRFWEATDAVMTRPGQVAETLAAPFRINGFEEQIDEVVRCVRGGQIESRRMPHAETLALARWMDRIRRDLGVRYPFD